MALYSCPDCGHNLSDKALACPGCGYMWRKRGWWAVTIGWGVIMSGVIVFLLSMLITVVTLTLAGVGIAGLAAAGRAASSQPSPTPRPFATPNR